MSGKGKDKGKAAGGQGEYGVLDPSPLLADVAGEKNIDKIIEQLANPREHELDFDQEVRHSTLVDPDPTQEMKNILQAFNQGRKSFMKTSPFGKTIEPGKFRLVERNNVPELVPPTETPMRKKLCPSPKDSSHEIGVFDQKALYVGGCGSHLVNVPNGRIAKVWINNNPVLLGPGPHVIHDQNFRAPNDADLVNYNDNRIDHGTYRIFRIEPNKFGMININNQPYFLVPREKPYVFKNPTIHIPEHYIGEMKSVYISHGNYHIVQVPQGTVAKVWVDGVPVLLESRREPYVFKQSTFQLEKHKKDQWFAPTTERLITHGSIKRILPRTGEVAVTYDNGRLVTFGPSDDRQPVLIASPNHSFERFIATNIQTMQFPSDATKQRRTKENKSSDKDIDYPDVNYEVFRTSDGLPIGVKLLVVYEINNPDMTLTKLDPDKINDHIEYLVSADMGMVIQHCSSTDFLKSNQNKKENDSSESEFYEQIQQTVFEHLRRDFNTYGIELHRLNIETPKILDKKISEEMAKFSLLNTETQAKEAVIGKQTALAKQEAQQKAAVKKIEQEADNLNKINAAKADLEAARMRQEAALVEAETKAKAESMAAEARMREKQLQLEIDEKRAAQFDKHPGLLQFQIAQLQSESMKGVNSTVISPEVAAAYYGLSLTNQALGARMMGDGKLKASK